MSETLMSSYILTNWVTVDGGWWQHIFYIMISYRIEIVCFIR